MKIRCIKNLKIIRIYYKINLKVKFNMKILKIHNKLSKTKYNKNSFLIKSHKKYINKTIYWINYNYKTLIKNKVMKIKNNIC